MNRDKSIGRRDDLMCQIDAVIARERVSLLDFDHLPAAMVEIRVSQFSERVEQQAKALIATEIRNDDAARCSSRLRRWSAVAVSLSLIAMTGMAWSISSGAALAAAPDAWPMLPNRPSTLDEEYVAPRVEHILKVSAHVGNARDLPDNSGRIVTRVKQGDIVTVLGEDKGWYQARLEDGTIAWIYSTVFAPRLKIGVDIANARKAPSNEARIVTRLNRGDYVTKLDEAQGWYLVKLDNGAELWVYKTVFEQ